MNRLRGQWAAARTAHAIFLRRGPFESIRQEEIQCAWQIRSKAVVFGATTAREYCLKWYLSSQARLLGYERTVAALDDWMHQLDMEGPDSYPDLRPRSYWHDAPSLADIKTAHREHCRAMRRVENRALRGWIQDYRDSEGALLHVAIPDGELRFGASLHRNLGRFRSLIVAVFSNKAVAHWAFEQAPFFLDLDAYLPVNRIPIEEFERRYGVLLGMVERVREALSG